MGNGCFLIRIGVLVRFYECIMVSIRKVWRGLDWEEMVEFMVQACFKTWFFFCRRYDIFYYALPFEI